MLGIIYFYVSAVRLGTILERRKNGEIWHSLSWGESVFGSENFRRDLIIAALIGILLTLLNVPIGLFFFASQFASYSLRRKHDAMLYRRYLDQMDAKIEHESLKPALEKGRPPKETSGLYCPLPKAFQGDHRARVARVIAGGPCVADAPRSPLGPRQHERSGAATVRILADAEPKDSADEGSSSCAVPVASASSAMHGILGAHPKVFACLAIALVAYAIWAPKTKEEFNQRFLAPAAQAPQKGLLPTAQKAVVPSKMPENPAPSVPRRTAVPALQDIPAPKAEPRLLFSSQATPDQAAPVSAGLAGRVTPQPLATAAQVTKPAESHDAQKSEREIATDQVRLLLADQAAQIEAFRKASDIFTTENLKLIEKATRSKRAFFTSKNDQSRQLVEKTCSTHKAILKSIEDMLPGDPIQARNESRSLSAQMEANRADTRRTLATLRTEIEEAKKKPFLFFK
jgi:hypothetical protein